MDPTSITYSSYSYETPAAVASSSFDMSAFFLAYMGLMLFVCIASYVVSSWLLSRIFKKAGIEEWKAWVPLYNTWIMLEMGKQKGWYLLLSLIPVVGSIIFLVFFIMALYEIGKSFGKEGIFVLWAIFIPVVWYAILAFDKSTWSGQSQSSTEAPTTTPQYMAPVQPVVPTQTSEPVDTTSSDSNTENQ